MTTKALIFSAPSGSGKTTIVKHLLSVFPQLCFSISATTRAPRGTEEHGREYYFFSSDEFDSKVADGQFLEWEEVYAGTKYGTLKEEVHRIWDLGKSVIFDVDVVGGLNLKKQLGEKALAVFVKVPGVDVLERRLENRNTEDQESLNKRISKARKELEFESDFDLSLLNDNLEEAKARAEAMVQDFLAK